MYAVVQGVGFANSAWTTALDYMQSTGESLDTRPVANAYTDASGTVLPLVQQSQICYLLGSL